MAMTEVAEVQAGAPELVSHGVYALYRRPDGGLVISYRPEGTHADLHLPIPAKLAPALDMLRQNPGALESVAASPMGRVAEGLARRMANGMTDA
jgi:hypothetical protein